MRRALVTGVTGQDGSYLAEFLLARGYQVHGVVRRSSSFNTSRIDHLYADPHESQDPGVAGAPRLRLHYGDVTDATCLRRLLELVRPDEVYNLAAQSHVRVAFDLPEYTLDVTAMGAVRLLDAVRDYVQHSGREVRVYQAGSSEMFGDAAPPQSETTPFRPRSPYAVAKVAAHHFATNYRDAYGLFVVNGILFNHESPRRGETFVTRKVTRAATRIKLGLQERLFLGNLGARRDWGFAGDYVEAMWLMLQEETADDYVVATGESHSVEELLQTAFAHVGLDWQAYVEVDPRYYRPTEVDHLLGDAAKARTKLRWRPRVSFTGLIEMMVAHDLELALQERVVRNSAGVGPAAALGG